jgi:hypothetical protein
MIVIGYEIEDAGWGHKYRRVSDKDQQLAVRALTGRTHVRWQDVEAFAQLNVYFHENAHAYGASQDSPPEMAYYTHMRGEHADGATQ